MIETMFCPSCKAILSETDKDETESYANFECLACGITVEAHWKVKMKDQKLRDALEKCLAFFESKDDSRPIQTRRQFAAMARMIDEVLSDGK